MSISPTLRDTLETLHEHHAEGIYRYAWSICRDESLAAETLQEVFLKLAHKGTGLDKVDSPKAMIFRMARNTTIDALRRLKVRRLTTQQWIDESPQWFEPASDEARDEEQRALAAALVSLTDEQRSVIHLHIWENLTFREIGDIHQIPAATAASRYRYGLAKLKQLLAQSEPTVEPKPAYESK